MPATLSICDPKAPAKAAVLEEAKVIVALAERGEIVDLSWAAARVDGQIVTSYTVTDDSPRRLGAVSRLLYRLQALAGD